MKPDRWIAGACLGIVILGMIRPAWAQSFRDDFDGTALNTAVWSVNAGDGQVVVGSGVVSVFGPGGAFPVVTTLQDPFPSGDFRLKVGMRYTAQNMCGDGFGAMDNFWDNYFHGIACRPFLLWQDNGGLYVYTGSATPVPLAGPPETGYHLYEWDYVDGQYLFRMDGEVRANGGCAPRATQIFFGHPQPRGCSAWTSFEIDFIEITRIEATPTRGRTWGGLKLVYR